MHPFAHLLPLETKTSQQRASILWHGVEGFLFKYEMQPSKSTHLLPLAQPFLPFLQKSPVSWENRTNHITWGGCSDWVLQRHSQPCALLPDPNTHSIHSNYRAKTWNLTQGLFPFAMKGLFLHKQLRAGLKNRLSRADMESSGLRNLWKCPPSHQEAGNMGINVYSGFFQIKWFNFKSFNS